MHRNPKKNFRSLRSGTTSVEFALVAPIIFIMFIGAVELTRLNFLRHSAANACFEGARKAIVPGVSDADAKTAALDLLKTLGTANGADVSVTSNDSKVTVQVTIPVNKNSWGIGRFGSGMNVTSGCTLTRETL
ncbi:MAG: TadE/TadG family type IV pilus assembly protein [Pirellula sp.]